MDVLIAGAGIGGLSAALALARGGASVRVFEQRGSSDADVGAGIQLSPNAMRVLASWGLGEAVDAAAFHPQRISLRNGRTLRRTASLVLGDRLRARHGFPYLHIHRGDLRNILFEALIAERGNIVAADTRIEAVLPGATRPQLRLADGRTVAGDVLIGADGIRSITREALFGADAPRFTGYVAWRGLVDAARARHLGIEPEAASYMVQGAHVVTYFVRSGNAINFVGVAERTEPPDETWENEGARSAFARDMAPFHPALRALAGMIERPLLWPLFDRAPLPHWSKGAITLLGDACHPMLPFLAQGACMAIEDAAVLSRCLQGASGPQEIASALIRYEQARKARTARVQAEARAQGRFFHTKAAPMAAITRAIMGAGARFAPNLALSRYDWLWGHDALAAPLPPVVA